MARKTPSAAMLAQIAATFAYDPETGGLTRRATGKPTGWVGTTGYLTVDLAISSRRSRKLKAHVVAWFLKTGAWPPGGLDVEHENRVRTDNRWSNLALKTRAQNLWNSNAHRDGALGIKGVYLHKPGVYRARICRYGKTRHLGLYSTPEAAARAYVEAGGVL